MDFFSGVSTDQLFVTSLQQQSQLEALANQALSSGIDKYQRKEYEAAARDFQKSINLMPSSSFVGDTTKYLAQTYLQLDKPDKAIEAYQRGIELNPDRDDLHADLGNLYFSEDRYAEALSQYQAAVRVNPASSSNHYSLGQGYLKTENLEQAKTEFNTVLRLEPNSPYGDYGLGLVYYQDQNYDKAIDKFETALRKDTSFYEAKAQMGYAYADMGEMDEAEKIVEYLEDIDTGAANLLNTYMNIVEPPKLLFAYSSSTFSYNMSINTPLSALDSYLETAGASKSLTMNFQFNKKMERTSVEDVYNWSISRSMGAGDGSAYNFGLEIPSTEVTLENYPDNVYYNSTTRTATLSFTLTQNDTADGTIDPSHIVFKFNGKDAEGISMDAQYDSFSGWSGVA